MRRRARRQRRTPLLRTEERAEGSGDSGHSKSRNQPATIVSVGENPSALQYSGEFDASLPSLCPRTMQPRADLRKSVDGPEVVVSPTSVLSLSIRALPTEPAVHQPRQGRSAEDLQPAVPHHPSLLCAASLSLRSPPAEGQQAMLAQDLLAEPDAQGNGSRDPEQVKEGRDGEDKAKARDRRPTTRTQDLLGSTPAGTTPQEEKSPRRCSEKEVCRQLDVYTWNVEGTSDLAEIEADMAPWDI